jgi:hypothetical protein
MQGPFEECPGIAGVKESELSSPEFLFCENGFRKLALEMGCESILGFNFEVRHF